MKDIFQPHELRKKAEEIFAERGSINPQTYINSIEKLIEELNIYQIELEMQNEELRKAQKDIEVSRKHYSDLYDFAPVGYITFNAVSNIMAMNNAVENLLEAPKSMLNNLAFIAFVDKASRKIFYDHLKETFDQNKKTRCEIKIRSSQATDRYLRLESARFYDEQEETWFCRTTLADISEEKKAQRILEASEKRYRALLETSAVPVMVLDDSYQIVEANKSCIKLLACKEKNEFLKKSLLDFIVPEQQAEVWQHYQTAFLTSTADQINNHVCEYALLASDDTIHNVVSYSNSLQTDTDQDKRLVISLHDITERLIAEQRIRQSELNLKAIIENTENLIVSIDMDSRILAFNQGMAQFIKATTKHDLKTGLLLRDILPPERVHFWEEKLNNIAKNNQRLLFEYPLEHPEKGIIELEVSVNPIVKDQVCEGFSALLRDITDRKIAEKKLINSEQELKQLNATKDKFFSIVAHDLKNPFNTLIGFSQLLATDIDKVDINHARKMAETIHLASKQGYSLLENLLQWSRSQTGHLEMNIASFRLSNLVHEAVLPLKASAKKKKLQVITDIDQELKIKADYNMISSVVRNLLSNAIKFSFEEKIIRIYSRENQQNKDMLDLVVEDQGVGISQENLKKLFRIDVNYSSPGTKNETGTGLGLILCKEFLEKNGGHIHVTSQPDKGSCFVVTLQREEAVNQVVIDQYSKELIEQMQNLASNYEPEALKKFRTMITEELIPFYETSKHVLSSRHLMAFSLQLQKIGQELNIPPLILYGRRLADKKQNFKLVELINYLSVFPRLIAPLQ